MNLQLPAAAAPNSDASVFSYAATRGEWQSEAEREEGLADQMPDKISMTRVQNCRLQHHKAAALGTSALGLLQAILVNEMTHFTLMHYTVTHPMLIFLYT